jgi:glycosyltransferase involved in cell wall biosynthesis
MILCLIDHYLPGARGGGAVVTLANLVERMAGEHRFRVLTRDHDLGEERPYPGIPAGRVVEQGAAEVIYLPRGELGMGAVRRAMRADPFELLHLSSFFSPRFSIQPLLLRRAGLVPRTPVVVAPRGEFSPGALRLKHRKKQAFVAAARASGLYDDVVWSVSNDGEAADVRALFPRADTRVAPDLAVEPEPPPARTARKAPGELRVMFLSRISRKKNLLGAVRMVAGLRGRVEFDVCGPVEDEPYWEECLREAERFPPGVRMTSHGLVPRARVLEMLSRADVFLLPTLGENFGHVVVEALLAGCLPVLSDRTPWRDLEDAGVGWALPFEDTAAFVRVLQACVEMDGDELARRAEAARAYGMRAVDRPGDVELNRALLRDVLR